MPITTRLLFIGLAILCIVALFAFIRAGGGLRRSNPAEQRGELFRELSVRRLLGRLLGGFAGIFFIAGVMSLFRRDSSGRVDWTTAVVMIGLSQFLVLCIWLLVRRTKMSPNQRMQRTRR